MIPSADASALTDQRLSAGGGLAALLSAADNSHSNDRTCRKRFACVIRSGLRRLADGDESGRILCLWSFPVKSSLGSGGSGHSRSLNDRVLMSGIKFYSGGCACRGSALHVPARRRANNSAANSKRRSVVVSAFALAKCPTISVSR